MTRWGFIFCQKQSLLSNLKFICLKMKLRNG
uniref:Uncharacterized protein n=1 Tax=Lepeophtheirus salmonis TaxID=72036 RepID=A0A0K2TEL7_LEPSM